jgi:hypothetical protein
VAWAIPAIANIPAATSAAVKLRLIIWFSPDSYLLFQFVGAVPTTLAVPAISYDSHICHN